MYHGKILEPSLAYVPTPTTLAWVSPTHNSHGPPPARILPLLDTLRRKFSNVAPAV